MDALAKLGIDGWGILLYLVNFGVLLVLMQRFVYKPLVKYLDERRNQIKENVESAKTMRASLEEEKQKEDASRKERLAALDERIKEAKKAVRDDAKDMLRDAEAQRDAILAQANKQAEDAIAGTVKGAEAEMMKRIKSVVMHVLEEGMPEDVVKKSVEDSWKAVNKA